MSEMGRNWARRVHLRKRPPRSSGLAAESGQSTKSLRDSPLRGAGELIKLNPLSTEQGYIGTVIDLD
jgi:hypothetical protein